MKTKNQQGFSLVELVIAMTAMVPLIMAAFGTYGVAMGTIKVNQTESDVLRTFQYTFDEIRRLSRSAFLSTMRTRANASDVAAAEAAKLLDPLVIVPAIGDWISVGLPTDRPGFRFFAASGFLTGSSADATELRTLDFVLDSSETDNGVDDDGDGLIDEGQILLNYGVTPVIVATHVEGFFFSLVGRVMTIKIQIARRGADGRMYRKGMKQDFFIRNN